MEDNVNVSEELKQKNQEMLLTKKKTDLEKSMESLTLFYDFHTGNVALDVNNKVCEFLNISLDSEQREVNYNIITAFFKMTLDQLKTIIDEELKIIENKMNNETKEQYFNDLNKMAYNVKNHMWDFLNGYDDEEDEDDKSSDEKKENIIDILVDELCENTDVETKKKVNKYLNDVITFKMINVLRDNLMVSIEIIHNNYKENQKLIDEINERTIPKVV